MIAKLIDDLTQYRDETVPEIKEELEKLNNINYELNVVTTHSADKVTFTKSTLLEYIDLACKYKLIEGLTLAINYIKDNYPETKED